MGTATVLIYLSLLIVTVVSDDNCHYCLAGSSYFSTDKPLSLEDLIKENGYTVESHEITTEDGYVLTYHRIPRGKNPETPLGRPVLVQHGILGSSASWVLSEESLGFTLADAGFDVWLANCRGNTYSRKHVNYNPDVDKKEFWDFSWHEIGHYDMPAAIDYILQQTGQENLLLVAHSMGTSAYFVMGATRPEYMEKVKAAVIMAPIVFPWHVRGELYKFLYAITETMSIVVSATGSYEILPYSNAAEWTDQHICTKQKLEFICADIIEGFGFYKTGIQRVNLDKVLEYNPAGTSYKILHHYKQISQEGHVFQQFDYGYVWNLLEYRSTHPPIYDLSKASAPLYVYYGENDWQSVPEDVFYLVDKLPNVKKLIKVEDEQFNHLDFMWAKAAKELVYNEVVAIFQNM